jgi:hypothetical protein
MFKNRLALAAVIIGLSLSIQLNANAGNLDFEKLKGIPVKAGPADMLPCKIDQPILDGKLNVSKYMLTCQRSFTDTTVNRVNVFASDIELVPTPKGIQGYFSQTYYARIMNK